MKAVKANKVYTIDEAQKSGYIAQGFDIQDDAGETVAYGRGKTVPVAEYVSAAMEIERLQGLVAELNERVENPENVDDENVTRVLSAYASEHGIDLGRASSVSGILKKIEEKPAESAEGGE